MVQNLQIDNDDYLDYTFDPNFEYAICKIFPEIGGRLAIELQDGSCQNISNPAVDFTDHENLPIYIINLPGGSGDLKPIYEQWTKGDDFILTSALQDASCDNVPVLLMLGDAPIFGQLPDGTWLQFDPRLNLKTNTLTDPQDDGGYNEVILAGNEETLCMNVPRTFQNENECFMSTMDTCGSTSSETTGVPVCGSPGEVRNMKEKGFMFDMFHKDYTTQLNRRGRNKEYVWMMIALSASDQLRQRVAWALSQVNLILKH